MFHMLVQKGIEDVTRNIIFIL